MADLYGAPIVRWKFAEPASGVLASDAEGLLPDLDTPSGRPRPDVIVGGVTGFGREFFDAAESSPLLVGVDDDEALDLRRSLTFQALVRFDVDAQESSATPGTLFSYGSRFGAGEDLQFLVELRAVDASARLANIRARWEDSTGAMESGNVGADWFAPVNAGGTPGVVLLTVVREWRSDTEVIVRYYANSMFLGRDDSTVGDIGGEPGATISIGGRGNGLGGYENYLEATVEAAAIWNRVLAPEEIRQIYRRVGVHPVEAYEAIKSLLPEGVYSNDPASNVQRELFVEATMFGEVLSRVFELREDWFADRAWSFLDRWESVHGIIPSPSATLAERRLALLSVLRTVEGFSKLGVREALEPTFDLDESDIEIVEFDHFLSDAFATAFSSIWHVHAADHSVSIVSGAARIALTASTDARWYSLGTGNEQATPHARCVIDRDERLDEPASGMWASVRVLNDSLADAGQSLIGLGVLDMATNNSLIVGLTNNGGTISIGYVRSLNGVQNAITILGVAPARPFFLHLRYNDQGEYVISTAPAADRNDVTDIGAAFGPEQPGFCILAGLGLDAAPSGVNRVDFDDFLLYTPSGLRVFYWYAYRDPGLDGSPDMPGADRVVQRIKPAHTAAAAIASLAFLCDDDGSLCDRDPIG